MRISGHRLLAIAALVLLGFAVWLAIDLNLSGQREVLRQFKAFQTLLARQASHELANYLQDCSRDLRNLARLAAIQRQEPAQMEAELKGFLRTASHLHIHSLCVVGPEGRVLLSAGGGAWPSNYARAHWLEWAARKENRGKVFVATNGLPAKAPKDPLGRFELLLATPVYASASNSNSNGSSRIWKGALLMVTDPEPILASQLSSVAPMAWTQRIWIVDQDGTILLQSEHPEMVRQNVFDAQKRCAQCHTSFDYVKEMLTNRLGITQYQLKGQPMKLAAFAPVQFANASWIMVVNSPYDQVTTFGRRSYSKMLLLLGLIAGVACLATVAVHRTNLSKDRAEAESRRWQEKLKLEGEISEAKERYRAQLEALHQVGLGITAQVEPEILLETITEQALKLFQGTAGGLFLHRPRQEILELVIKSGNAPAAVGTSCHKGEGLAGRVWETGTPQVVTDYQCCGGRKAGLENGLCAASMAAPIRWWDDFVGVMEICSDKTQFFSPEAAKLLGLFATQAAIAIKNAGLLERVRQDATLTTTLLHDVNHRVKNNLMRLTEIIRLEREQAAPSERGLKAALSDLESRLLGMEVVHSMLSSTQWKPLSLSDLLTQILTSALSGSPIRQRIRVSVATPSEALWVVPEQAAALALIFNELATNSVKHAFRDREQGCLSVRVQIEEKSGGRARIRLDYRDDGPGWPEPVLQGHYKRVGLQLVEASVRSPLRGQMILRNDGGAAAELSFRLASAE
jgi:two-component sensor histidine kinase